MYILQLSTLLCTLHHYEHYYVSYVHDYIHYYVPCVHNYAHYYVPCVHDCAQYYVPCAHDYAHYYVPCAHNYAHYYVPCAHNYAHYFLTDVRRTNDVPLLVNCHRSPSFISLHLSHVSNALVIFSMYFALFRRTVRFNECNLVSCRLFNTCNALIQTFIFNIKMY